jgi:hypothetical protein
MTRKDVQEILERVLTWPAERQTAVVRAAHDAFARVPYLFRRTLP